MGEEDVLTLKAWETAELEGRVGEGMEDLCGVTDVPRVCITISLWTLLGDKFDNPDPVFKLTGWGEEVGMLLFDGVTLMDCGRAAALRTPDAVPCLCPG